MSFVASCFEDWTAKIKGCKMEDLLVKENESFFVIPDGNLMQEGVRGRFNI